MSYHDSLRCSTYTSWENISNGCIHSLTLWTLREALTGVLALWLTGTHHTHTQWFRALCLTHWFLALSLYTHIVSRHSDWLTDALHTHWILALLTGWQSPYTLHARILMWSVSLHHSLLYKHKTQVTNGEGHTEANWHYIGYTSQRFPLLLMIIIIVFILPYNPYLLQSSKYSRVSFLQTKIFVCCEGLN